MQQTNLHCTKIIDGKIKSKHPDMDQYDRINLITGRTSGSWLRKRQKKKN